jgi:hypothetical protein
MILNDLSKLTPDGISAIRSKYGKEGRVLLWVGNPGFHSGASLDETAKAFGLGI